MVTRMVVSDPADDGQLETDGSALQQRETAKQVRNSIILDRHLYQPRNIWIESKGPFDVQKVDISLVTALISFGALSHSGP
jgi:hypothetical protein